MNSTFYIYIGGSIGLLWIFLCLILGIVRMIKIIRRTRNIFMAIRAIWDGIIMNHWFWDLGLSTLCVFTGIILQGVTGMIIGLITSVLLSLILEVWLLLRKFNRRSKC